MEKPNKKSEKGYSPGNHIRYLLKGIWNSDKRLMLLMLLEMACTVITPYVAMYLPKIGVDLVTSHAPMQTAIWVLAALTGVLIVSQGLGNMANRGKTRRLDRVRSYFRIQLFCKTLDCDYEHAESAEWQDKYEQARIMSVDWGPWSATTLMSEGIILLGSAVVSVILYGGIIFSLTPWMLLLILALSVVNFLALRRAQKYEASGFKSAVSCKREEGIWSIPLPI